MMNGIVTYGFGEIYNPGFIVIYGMGSNIRPVVVLSFDLSIQQEADFSLIR